MRKYKIFRFIPILILLLVICGCSSDTDTSREETAEPTVTAEVSTEPTMAQFTGKTKEIPIGAYYYSIPAKANEIVDEELEAVMQDYACYYWGKNKGTFIVRSDVFTGEHPELDEVAKTFSPGAVIEEKTFGNLTGKLASDRTHDADGKTMYRSVFYYVDSHDYLYIIMQQTYKKDMRKFQEKVLGSLTINPDYEYADTTDSNDSDYTGEDIPMTQEEYEEEMYDAMLEASIPDAQEIEDAMGSMPPEDTGGYDGVLRDSMRSGR